MPARTSSSGQQGLPLRADKIYTIFA